MLNQLQDLKAYLVTKIESRFFELNKDVQKSIQTKKKAIENRKKFLDRNLVQVSPLGRKEKYLIFKNVPN